MLRARRALVTLAACAVAVVSAAGLLHQNDLSLPGRTVASIFQDDQLLLYQPSSTAGAQEVQRTLMALRGLGVDVLRLTVEWAYIAPAQRPASFDAADPADYPAANWIPYDRIDRLAAQDGLRVDFDVTGPGPAWAMSASPSAAYKDVYEPSTTDFEQFVQAVGRRYGGDYVGSRGALAAASRPLPRVSFWSVWNEPNQPGWLAPQYRRAQAGASVPVSPALYRSLLDAAWSGLARSGHTPARDTILAGELAPESIEHTTAESAISPMPFLRALYCVGPGYHRLAGAGAAALGCPRTGTGAAFVAANPALFEMTGFALHPYSFFLAPGVSIVHDPSDVPISDLDRIERGLDGAFAAYGSARRLPLYLTEYGYETDPPNPFRGVSLARQARYIDQGEYLAWRDPRVRAMAQFLLRDAPPDTAYKPGTLRYWSTFQSGLEFVDGAPKPALGAYRLPIFLPRATVGAGGRLLVWGMLRPARNGTRQTARIQWRAPSGAFRTLATVATNDPSGFLEARIRPPASGAVRLAWTGPSGTTYYSLGVPVSVGG